MLRGKALDKSVNAKYEGSTTLHYALRRGYYDLVPKLIEYAADKNEFVTAPDALGETALHLAVFPFGTSDIATVVEAIRELVKHATDQNEYITTRNHEGMTALHYAASREYVEPVETLLALSDNRENYVNVKDGDGKTPLHQAAMSDSADVAALLLKSGAEAETRDEYGGTPWDIACMKRGEESWRFLATLILFARQGEVSGLPFSILPATNMAEVYIHLCEPARRLNILKRGQISAYSRLFDTDTGLVETMAGLLRHIRKEFRENQEAQRPYLRSREPSCTVLNPKLKGGDYSFKFLSLVIPHIYIDKREVLDQRELEFESADRAKYFKYCTKDSKNFEWHMPTTLDEYCNPSLSKAVLDERNDDQVLGRYEGKKNVTASAPLRDGNGHHRELRNELWILVRAYIRKFIQFFGLKIPRELKRKEEAKQNAEGTKARAEGENTTTAGVIKAVGGRQLPENVVFVHQAWVWVIGEDVIVTQLFPGTRENYAIWQEVQSRDQVQGIAYFLNEAVRHLETPAVGPEGSLLRTYENALVVISEEVSQYTKSTRFEDIDLDKEKDLFHQISDLREEVSMIKSVLAEQEEVWTEFMRLMGPNKELYQQQGRHSSTGDGMSDTVSESGSGITERDSRWGELWQLQTQFDKYKRRTRKLEEDAERVEKNILTMLDLKQKHAAMREAHSTAVLGATVFGFTIITVIFAPLAFVAALFALPIDKFNEGKDMNGTDGVYSSSYIGKWSVATEFVSIAITLIAMWAGLRFAGLHVRGERGLREYIRQKADAICKEEKSKDMGSEEEGNEGGGNEGENNRGENNEEGSNVEEGKAQPRGRLRNRLNRILVRGGKTNDVETGRISPGH
ncbi:hypothetical protein ANO14919_045810 [Xylariales sp. No.14919]|nr:hypothetical protein ANO14919_045810 [Xylariales sp. No.14919]